MPVTHTCLSGCIQCCAKIYVPLWCRCFTDRQSRVEADYGIHDLAGNLYEWVADWYDEAVYTPNPTIDPRGPAEGTMKVQRGGSYLNNPYRLRASFRTKSEPTEHAPNVGFRCAQDVPTLP